MKSRWSIPALGAFFVVIALVVAGCGSSGVPSGAVASVSGNPISKAGLDHWMYVYEKGQLAQEPTEPVIVPNDPPQFNNCITQVRADIPQLKKDSAAKLRTECKAAFTQIFQPVMDFLVKGYWYQAYAHKLGISVTNAQITKELNKEKKAQGISKPSAYAAFLKQYGYTNADLVWRTRYTLVYSKLEKKYATKVTPAAISAYYKAHASTFGTPETRNLRIVLAKTSATAKTALAALKKGESWKTVAKKYSTDPTTKDNGGLLTDVSKGQEDAALSNAAFAAPVNKLEGPVKGQFGYYVLEVIKVTPATHQSLTKATPEIKSTLTSEKQTAAVNTINKKVKALYGANTLCKATYSMDDCHGYKKPKTTATTPATGSTTPASTGTATTGATTSTASSSTTTSASSTK